ncbi:MAG TPA: hypothetical protein PLJ34_10285, partial [Hyphomicrobiales bacterium]|nr:hypothetical protein [Hyphomicrobiales bacterium]
MILRSLAILALTAAPAAAHEGFVEHVHPHPDSTLAAIVLVIVGMAAALFIGLRRDARRVKGHDDD